jgi:hydrogenase maturation protease
VKLFAVGNSFYGDDGVAAAVLAEVRARGLLRDEDLWDLHTDALDLVDRFRTGELNIIVDAAHMGLEPGEVAVFRAGEVRMKIQSDHLSMHGFGLAEACELALQLGRLPQNVLIVGVEPAVVEIGKSLSAPVEAAVPRVVDLLASIIQGEVPQHV